MDTKSLRSFSGLVKAFVTLVESSFDSLETWITIMRFMKKEKPLDILRKLRKQPYSLVLEGVPGTSYSGLIAEIENEQHSASRHLSVSHEADRAMRQLGILPAEESLVKFVFGPIYELFGLDPGPSGHTAIEVKDLLDPDYLLANGFKLCEPGDGPRMLSKLKVGTDFKMHRILMSPVESSEGNYGIYEIGAGTLGLSLGFSGRNLGKISCLHSDEHVVLREV